MSCSPAVRLTVPELVCAPCAPSLSTTRTLSTNTRVPSSLLVVNVVGPGWVMLIIPAQRAPKLVVVVCPEYIAAGPTRPPLNWKLGVPPVGKLLVWKDGLPLMRVLASV